MGVELAVAVIDSSEAPDHSRTEKQCLAESRLPCVDMCEYPDSSFLHLSSSVSKVKYSTTDITGCSHGIVEKYTRRCDNISEKRHCIFEVMEKDVCTVRKS